MIVYIIKMPSTSENQVKFFRGVMNAKEQGKTTGKFGKVASTMTKKQIQDFLKLKPKK